MRLTIALFMLAISVSQVRAEPFDWIDFRSRIHAALGAGSHETLVRLRDQLEARAAEPAAWRHYWSALIAYRAGVLIWADDEGEAKQLFQACIEKTRAAIEAGEESGESRGLLGGCYGQLARGGAMAGMRYGSKSSTAADLSLLDAPDNPRVLIFAGIRDLYTPIMFGGDPERAARRLERARKILKSTDSDQGDPWLPRWGRVDAHGHLALALTELDRPDEARAVLDEARAAGIESEWLDAIAGRVEAQRR